MHPAGDRILERILAERFGHCEIDGEEYPGEANGHFGRSPEALAFRADGAALGWCPRAVRLRYQQQVGRRANRLRRCGQP